MMNNCVDIFIPSYHRHNNCKTVKYFKNIGWDMQRIHVFIDNETDDILQYDEMCKSAGCNLVIFDMDEARRRYDYIHRPSPARRSAGQARNMMQDYAMRMGITFYCVNDDDTQGYYVRDGAHKSQKANGEAVRRTFNFVREFMCKHKIGLFGLSQTGDLIGGICDNKIFRKKVMNTSFYLLPYIYRGERGVQDDDTSMFVGLYNEGYFTGSLRYGLILQQCQSAKQSGGLTDLYNECKLLNKALVVPIQFPFAVYAERQKKNGGRLHHHVLYRYIMPCILRNSGGRNNISWDTYEEDVPFTNEPKKRKYGKNKEIQER